MSCCYCSGPFFVMQLFSIVVIAAYCSVVVTNNMKKFNLFLSKAFCIVVTKNMKKNYWD